jgi:hypothetical protein
MVGLLAMATNPHAESGTGTTSADGGCRSLELQRTEIERGFVLSAPAIRRHIRCDTSSRHPAARNAGSPLH